MEILNKYVKKSSETASRIIEGEAVIVIPKSSDVHTLNPVATRIWDLADGSKKVTEIVSVIQDEYNGEPSQIRQDSIDFINTMVDKNMLTLHDKPNGALQ